MAENFPYDLIVIGSGPGGYVAAIRAAQLGLKVVVVEKDKPGGVCLNIGCIPSKSLIHQASLFHGASYLRKIGCVVDAAGLDFSKVLGASRTAADRLSRGVNFLLKKNGVDYRQGHAVLTGPHEVTLDGHTPLHARFILIATGSRPRMIDGFAIDENQVLSSTGALMLNRLPSSVIILGSGAIGIEFAYIWACFGVKVTVVEMLGRILPAEDADCSKIVERGLAAQGVTFVTSAKATELSLGADGPTITYQQSGATRTLSAEKLLVAIGRQPNSESLGLEALGINLQRGCIMVGDYYQTNVPGIYAIGDVINSPQLAHVASKEGEIAVSHMAGRAEETRVDPDLIPSAVYCEPQVASFGPTEELAQKTGKKIEVAKFPFSAIGKAVATEEPMGQVKLITDEKTGEILAAHIVGAQATELIHEILLAKKAELLADDVATMIHAHPTLSEGVMEAARAAEGWAIHV